MPDLSFLHASPFYELTALIALAAVIGSVGLLLRQPMIVSFIAVGVLAGPSTLGIVQSHEHIELLAELGIAVLLFLVGLKLDLKLIRTLGPVALATGLGQVTFTSVIGFLVGLALGLDTVTSLYVAVALTFSSTVIIVKLLSDKREVDSLHGRIAIGFLIVQDLVVVLAMVVLSAFGVGAQEGSDGSVLVHIGTVLLYGLMMLGFIVLFIRYLATPLVSRIAHSQELLIILAIAWAALLAAIGSELGFSKEFGGLFAGILLASTPEVRRWRAKGHAAIYGDASDPSFIPSLPLGGVKWIVSAMPQHDIGVTHEDPRLILLEGLKQQRYSAGIAISTQHLHDQEILREKGARLVLLPFYDAAEQAVVRMKAQQENAEQAGMFKTA